MEVRDKVVLVTGANRGIGKALVEGFLRHGASKVYAAVRTLSMADALVQDHGSDCVVPLHLDLAQPQTISDAASVATDVQIVVNNAGILEMANPLDGDDFLSALQRQMDVNVYGLTRMAQSFVPIVERNGGGAFVQINSVASLRCPSAAFAAYSASKAAAFAVTQGLRNSLRNTLVMSVHPGPIATDMVDQFNGRDRAEPASNVAECVVEGLRKGDFLVYTDARSREIGAAYEGFATAVIEPHSKFVES